MGAQTALHSLAPDAPKRGAAVVRRHEQEERKRSFLRMVSHELRTPLNSIIGFSEIISCELYGPINEPRYREHAEIVRESGLKLLKLVNQVMEIARLESGAADLHLSPEALRPAVDEAVASFDNEAEARGLRFVIDISPEVTVVKGDSRAIHTVLTNLIQNAVTFSPEGGVVTVCAMLHGRSVWIEVRDQGEGIEPGQIPRLMRPFEQGEAPLTRRSEGAGLGLPIARLLCRAISGSLRLHSRPGEGVTAQVRLPAATTAADPAA